MGLHAPSESPQTTYDMIEQSTTLPYIRVDGLSVRYKTGPHTDFKAVEEVSFDLERGGTLGIVGESGCGKSTLARALLGYTRPGSYFYSGSVHIGDKDVLKLDDESMRDYRGVKASMVPQNSLGSLTPHQTVGKLIFELVCLHSGLRGKAAKSKVLELMDSTQLPDPAKLYDRYPHELSGGQRQRLVIAAALVAKPELIVLDEPTTALDKTVETKVLELVREMQRDMSTTLVYVSHDINVIASMCKHVLVMYDGLILERGNTLDVFASPSTPYARELVGSVPRLSRFHPVQQDSKKPEKKVGGSDTTQSLLRVTDLSFQYKAPKGMFTKAKRNPKVIDRVSFDIAPGQVLGLVGESGSGKSTIANLIVGLVTGYTGTIQLSGEKISGLAKHRDRNLTRRIQIIFQDPLSSLNPQHTVETLLCRPMQIFFGYTRNQSRDEAVKLLEELELSSNFLARQPRQLSGGQQQRIAIARAFAVKPELVLCDEITSALDVTIQAQVLEILGRLKREYETSYLFISHDLAVVSSISDTLMVLEHGQIRDYGPCADVIAKPTSPYTERLLDSFESRITDIVVKKDKRA